MPEERADRVFAVSDLHMGASDADAIFHAGAELASLVGHVRATPGRVDLVILGDALDYLTVSPYLSFTRKVAIEKTLAIMLNNDEVFSALAELVATPSKRLFWVLGNHDLELLFPEVRDAIEERLFGKRARGPLRWVLQAGPLDYQLGKVGTLRLVHGNTGDPWNSVDYDAARSVAETGGDPAFAYPPGSRLVAEVLHPLKAAGHRHVDLLKPEQSVALPLTLALWPQQTSALLKTAFPLLASVKASKVKNAVGALLGGQRATFGAAAPSDAAEAMLLEALASAVPRGSRGATDASDVDALLGLIDAGVAPQAPRGQVFGAKDFVSRLLRRSAQLSNAHDVFALDQEDELSSVVRDTFTAKPEISVLVAGHTHLARSMSLPGGHYFNLGTWADLMRLPRALESSEFTSLAQNLGSSLDGSGGPSALRPFRRLTYLDVELAVPNGPPAYRARLSEWSPSPTLAEVP